MTRLAYKLKILYVVVVLLNRLGVVAVVDVSVVSYL